MLLSSPIIDASRVSRRPRVSQCHPRWGFHFPKHSVGRDAATEPLVAGSTHCANPNKETLCGLPPPLSVMESKPPPETCDQSIVIEQDCPAPKLLGQVFFWEKGPVIVMPVMLNAVFPGLVKVIVCPGVQMQRNPVRHEKRTLVEERLTTVPVPLREINCGLPGASSLTESIPVRLPAALGMKETSIVQLAPAARLEPQLWVSLKLPIAPIFVMVTAAVP
jgi:hypothetical protein